VKLDIAGKELIEAGLARVWLSLNDPAFLMRCIPGCRSMREIALDRFAVSLSIQLAAVGGTFEGSIALSEKVEQQHCLIAVSGQGTLGHGSGEARMRLEPADGGTLLIYTGSGEVGGLIAGVGQRVLRGISKYLIASFVKSVRRELTGD
jgi:uncharacterized protein